ncbi:putative 2-dehydropantoate 2-reductase [Smittium culicis]|uniref:2-dehydropantoate 2-reductase n=1 Tax=Smittium culicis TaxID=133412 RepID=A0A1R1YF69_9FUNG|nr:putative 2-dehydropantoate 2-reductase [Smittium culicis]
MNSAKLKNEVIHILGVGSIGSLIAFHLSKMGKPVSLIFRNREKEKLFSENGFRLGLTNSYLKRKLPQNSSQIVSREFQEHIQVLKKSSGLNFKSDSISTSDPKPIEKINKLIITTKTFSTVEAISSVYNHLSLQPEIFLLQNGMGVAEEVFSFFKSMNNEKVPKLILGTTTHGCMPDTDIFCYVHTGFGTCHISEYISEYNLKNTDVSYASLNKNSLISTLLQLPLNVELAPGPDIDIHLLKKLVVNAVLNPISAIVNCRNGLIFEKADIIRKDLISDLCTEISSIITNTYKEDRIKSLFTRDFIYNTVFDVCQVTYNNYSSMNIDFNSKRQTEIKYINGYLINIANKNGVGSALNKLLYDLISNTQPSVLDPEILTQ